MSTVELNRISPIMKKMRLLVAKLKPGQDTMPNSRLCTVPTGTVFLNDLSEVA
jgi:hypothetical protein